MSEIMATNKSLRTEVESLTERLAKDESSTFMEERNLLLAETDTLLAETDRMTEQSKELAVQREELGAEANSRSELRSEVTELLAANVEQTRCHSELKAELAAARAHQPGLENSDSFRSEKDDLQRRTNELSLEVVNLRAKMHEQSELLAATEARFWKPLSLWRQRKPRQPRQSRFNQICRRKSSS
jgi:hypothetical protein